MLGCAIAQNCNIARAPAPTQAILRRSDVGLQQIHSFWPLPFCSRTKSCTTSPSASMLSPVSGEFAPRGLPALELFQSPLQSCWRERKSSSRRSNDCHHQLTRARQRAYGVTAEGRDTQLPYSDSARCCFYHVADHSCNATFAIKRLRSATMGRTTAHR